MSEFFWGLSVTDLLPLLNDDERRHEVMRGLFRQNPAAFIELVRKNPSLIGNTEMEIGDGVFVEVSGEDPAGIAWLLGADYWKNMRDQTLGIVDVKTTRQIKPGE